MRSLLLASLLVLTESALFAQRKPGVRISLSPPSLPNTAPDRLFGIDSVYTLLEDTASIGVAYRAMIGESARIYMKDGLSKELRQFLYASYPLLKSQYEPVRVRVEEFSYSEDPAQGLSFETTLMFLKQDSTQQFVPFYRAELSQESRGPLLPRRSALIQQNLLRGIDAMNHYLNDPVSQPAYFSDYERQMADAATDMKLDTIRYSFTERTSEDDIRYCQKRRTGIYLTVEELLKNRPSLTGSINFQQKNEVATLLRPNGRPARYRFFGFCDGTNLYINSSRYGNGFSGYARVLNVGRYILWRDDYLSKAEIESRAATSQFGLIGGLIGAAATNRRDCIAIDSETGKLFQVTPEKAVEILISAPTLLSEYETNGRSRKAEQLYQLMVRFNKIQEKQ